MIIKELRECISEINPDAVIFDNPSFDNSIVAMTEDNRVVYDFDKMIEELALEDDISIEEAQEFIEYNTIRTIPYIHENAPEIIYPLPY